MAPRYCHCPSEPLDEYPKKLEGHKLPVWVGILLGLLVVSLSATAVLLAAKANSPAGKDGLRAEQECEKFADSLESKLGVTLMIALLMEMAVDHQQQEVVQKLQEEIKTLNQELEEKSYELEQLRQLKKALVPAKCPPNSGISLILSMAPVLLTLSLQALLA